METADLTEDETAAVAAAATALLLAHHPAATFDATGAVATAGFLCLPGAPGTEQARVGHRAPFPRADNDRTFAGNAAEEFVLVAAYADLLREDGWMVREVTTTRPGLLISKPSALPHRSPVQRG
ncbi:MULTISPECIES: hypothetical protein [Streptomyces]|uniref:Uncharacterized protein n=1 Tax=Streptomyces zinciresistens K42 TaxID=700597 RepID=G2GB92_9ACTN|nr:MULTISPECIES: hypothetical protein [Streptomyces]EGX59188.1 hypothetical protein SZN_13831 [Streptomyces zinciresistens K42]MDT9695959.1 hypothetical protein [Streptomyces sp. P17]